MTDNNDDKPDDDDDDNEEDVDKEAKASWYTANFAGIGSAVTAEIPKS